MPSEGSSGGTPSGLLKKSKQTAVCFPLKFPGVRFPSCFFRNSSFQDDLVENQHSAMQEVKTLKEIERRLARFSLKVDTKQDLYKRVKRMVFKTIDDVVDKAVSLAKPKHLAVAAAEHDHVLEAVLRAQQAGFIKPWLIGRKAQIKELVNRLGGSIEDECYIDVQSNDSKEIAARTIRMVKDGRADFIMKGKLNTSDILRAALNKETGLDHDKVVTSFAFAQIPGFKKLVVFNDSGIIPHPTLEQKAEQIKIVSQTLRNMGYDEDIMIAALCAAETVEAKIPETVEAAKLKEMCDQGEFPGCRVEGPISLDLALKEEAAKIKGYDSPVAGNADVLLFPNLVSGNLASKMLTFFGGGISIGMAVGAGAPIAMSSRAASADTKFRAIALAATAVKEAR